MFGLDLQCHTSLVGTDFAYHLSGYIILPAGRKKDTLASISPKDNTINNSFTLRPTTPRTKGLSIVTRLG